ncbi:MAG: BREX-1 system adenine-specific DNA-methyltransferase PglX [Candidatus Desulfofervidaceae bacterium]|nr:BREX-1 system adenine-specific DNA-methyltransferase PglX [Candidatus Desulfofervidaceae bacterium]
MHPKLADTIKKMTLTARELLIREVSEQLEGIYGFLPDGTLKPKEQYPALQNNPEAAAETRRRIEEFVENEKLAGLSTKKAREKLVREAAFTWLNRFVAFKMLEARKLIRQTISRAEHSNGFLIWLTEAGNEPFYEDYNKGDLPQDELGEGPRQRAYRRFIIAQCAKLAREIRVLFDPDVLPSWLFPRPRVLKKLIELLNAEELASAWQPGNEETIGWVYQHYVSVEKDKIFKRLYQQKQKIKAEEVPLATQIFTPRWIVRFLVENTLGRIWVQMHPDTRLRSKLQYLVPLDDANLPSVVTRPVKDIKLMDPACGTMHFGLVAFDLFCEMYEEELEKTGEPGWPLKPSVQSKDEIPQSILENNIWGIEIDLRALQLAALALYLKAKSYNKDAQIKNVNLACTDILWLDGERLKVFAEKNFSYPIYRRAVEAVWKKLQKAHIVGSLLRVEEELKYIVQEERKRFLREGKDALPFPELKEIFEDEARKEDYWRRLEEEIIQTFDNFVRQVGERKPDTFFEGEAAKGLRLLHFMRDRYDIVVTNPPYLFRRNMEKELAEFLEDQYPDAKGDLYAAFIARCTELLNETGRLGMITQQSFMFVSTYEKFRKSLLQQHVLETMCHVGPRAFEELQGEKANTTAFVLRREPDESIRKNAVGVYFRLVKEKDGEAKRMAFEKALEELRKMYPDLYK